MNLEDRLISWGQWSRQSKSQGEAQSFEGQYRSPQSPHWLEGEAPREESPQVDPDDCRRVELAWSTLVMQDKIILRGKYCYRYGVKRTLDETARATHRILLNRDWLEYLCYAHSAIGEALKRAERTNQAKVRRWYHSIGGCNADLTPRDEIAA